MSSKEFFFSSGKAKAGLAVTPGSFGPCSTFARAKAGSERANALPAPSFRNSHRRRHCLGLLQGRSFRAALLPGVPPLARGALLVGGQLRPMLVADEARTRAARPIRTAFYAAAHVQRPARAWRLCRDADDALSGHRRRQLPLRLEPAVPLEDALLLGGGKLLGVILAEPPVARAGTRLAAARYRTEPAGEPPIRAST